MSATTASRTTTIVYSGAVAGTQEIAAAANSSSPGSIQLAALVTGNNTITAPAGATAATIVPASDNTTALTLKGVAGDTGIALLKTDPTTLALDPSTVSFVINAAANVVVRIFWT